MLCKDTPVHLPKLADILGQLLLSGRLAACNGYRSASSGQEGVRTSVAHTVVGRRAYRLFTEDPRESAEVKKALLALVVQDPRVCLLSLFSSVLNGTRSAGARWGGHALDSGRGTQSGVCFV
eukprot:scaffold451_cov365-Prasinococcus_capsulatus_cf.AAC.4